MGSFKMQETMNYSSSRNESKTEELPTLEIASLSRRNSKKILSRQQSISEIQREEAWERKRHHMGKQSKEVAIANPNELSDEDLHELKGCIELGFGFHEEKGGQILANTLPALDLYFAVNRLGSPTSSPRCASSPGAKFSPFGSASSKSLDEGNLSSLGSEDSWKICGPGFFNTWYLKRSFWCCKLQYVLQSNTIFEEELLFK